MGLLLSLEAGPTRPRETHKERLNEMSLTWWWTWSWYQTFVVILLFIIALQLGSIGQLIGRAHLAIACVARQIELVWDRVDRIADDRKIIDALDDLPRVLATLHSILDAIEQPNEHGEPAVLATLQQILGAIEQQNVREEPAVLHQILDAIERQEPEEL